MFLLPDEEDILADPNGVPYTAEIDAALHPHMEVLTELLQMEPGDRTQLTAHAVPVLEVLQVEASSEPAALRAAREKGVVPYVGNLDITTRAQIHNWFDRNVPEARV